MCSWWSSGWFFNSHPHEEDDEIRYTIVIMGKFSTHILTRRMTLLPSTYLHFRSFSTHILTRRMTTLVVVPSPLTSFSTHILTRRMTKPMTTLSLIFDFSTHILTRRMTAILNKIFSFKIKLYIHYNILFAIFYIYNSILYPFSSQKYSYSGANDSANSCSLAFRTPRFPVPSLQIHFP